MRFVRLLWITTRPGRAWVGSVTNKHNPSTESGLGACISSRITTVIHVRNDHQINCNCFNEPFAVLPYRSLYWDMHGLIFETSIWLLAGSTRLVNEPLNRCTDALGNQSHSTTASSVATKLKSQETWHWIPTGIKCPAPEPMYWHRAAWEAKARETLPINSLTDPGHAYKDALSSITKFPKGSNTHNNQRSTCEPEGYTSKATLRQAPIVTQPVPINTHTDSLLRSGSVSADLRPLTPHPSGYTFGGYCVHPCLCTAPGLPVFGSFGQASRADELIN